MDTAAIVALSSLASVVLTAFGGKVLIPAIRAYFAGRARLKRESARARDEEREDTARHFTLALDTSEKAREQIAQWMREERARTEDLQRQILDMQRELTDYGAKLVSARADLRIALRKIRDLEEHNAQLRETLLRDYVRRSIPAGPPEEPIVRALREVKESR